MKAKGSLLWPHRVNKTKTHVNESFPANQRHNVTPVPHAVTHIPAHNLCSSNTKKVDRPLHLRRARGRRKEEGGKAHRGGGGGGNPSTRAHLTTICSSASECMRQRTGPHDAFVSSKDKWRTLCDGESQRRERARSCPNQPPHCALKKKPLCNRCEKHAINTQTQQLSCRPDATSPSTQ